MRLYVTLGTNDLERAVDFYDAVFGVLGVPRLPDWTPGRAGWGDGPDDGTGLWVCAPFDGRAATVGNGTMVGLPADSAARVRACHAAGLAHGGADEGAPGLRDRYAPTFYVAYLRDPDGNKLSVFCYSFDPARDARAD